VVGRYDTSKGPKAPLALGARRARTFRGSSIKNQEIIKRSNPASQHQSESSDA
jgi:hypothetical protein